MSFYLLPKTGNRNLLRFPPLGIKQKFWGLCVFLIFFSGCSYSSLFAQPEISIEVIANGFNSPVDLTHAGDERLFVVEQDGRIKIIDENNQVLSTPFLDIDSQVNSNGNEQGLLGLAFHPDYANNGYFFVHYNKNNGDTRISRFTVSGDNPNIADPNSELIILEADQPYSNHNGGCIKFGPDGYLYIGMGDGGSGGDPQGFGQNRQSWLGKMLRIDIDNGDPYSVPETNPFAFDDFTLDEIWAIGLRNPWRFSFDRLTGDLWIADVGQNEWEEVDFQPADSQGGENYGWRCYEGYETYNNNPDECPDESELTEPIQVYSNSFSQGCSITGGFVYRGEEFPQLYGHYIYTDFCSGRIWSITKNDTGEWVNVELLNSTNNEFSSFGENLTGELYLTGRSSGKIYRIVELCTVFSVEGAVENETCEGDENGSITLDISNGASPYQIDWSNGMNQATIGNLASGTYSVTVLDNNGCERSDTFNITNGTPVNPVIATVENVLSVPGLYASYQWYFNGDAIEGATEASYEATESGDYYIEVTSAEGCTVASTEVSLEVNALDELGLNSLTIGPNPFSDEVNLTISSEKSGTYKLLLRAVSGKVVYESEETISGEFKQVISLKGLPAGTYLFSINKNGKEIVRKLTKQ